MSENLSEPLAKTIIGEMSTEQYAKVTDEEQKASDATVADMCDLMKEDEELESLLIPYLKPRRLVHKLDQEQYAEEFKSRCKELMDATREFEKETNVAIENKAAFPEEAIMAYIHQEINDNQSIVDKVERGRDWYPPTSRFTSNRSEERDVDLHNFHQAFSSAFRAASGFKELWDKCGSDIQNLTKEVFTEHFSDSPHAWPESVFKEEFEEQVEKVGHSEDFQERALEVFDEEEVTEAYSDELWNVADRIDSTDAKYSPQSFTSDRAWSSRQKFANFVSKLNAVSTDRQAELYKESIKDNRTPKGMTKLNKLDNPPLCMQKRILKDKINVCASSGSTKIADINFDLSSDLIDNLTKLQLAKSILSGTEKWLNMLQEVEDFDYYKEKLKRLVLQGDERGKKALNLMKQVYNKTDEEDEESAAESNKRAVEKFKQKAVDKIKSIPDNYSSLKDLINDVYDWVGDNAKRDQLATKLIEHIKVKSMVYSDSTGNNHSVVITKDDAHSLYTNMKDEGWDFS